MTRQLVLLKKGKFCLILFNLNHKSSFNCFLSKKLTLCRTVLPNIVRYLQPRRLDHMAFAQCASLGLDIYVIQQKIGSKVNLAEALSSLLLNCLFIKMGGVCILECSGLAFTKGIKINLSQNAAQILCKQL